MSRHIATTFLLWAVITALGELLVIADIFPVVGSPEAEDFDSIFRTLVIVGVPVFAFVVAIVIYSLFGFRAAGVPTSDGPAMKGKGKVPVIWVALTSALAIGVMIFPGLTGLSELQADSNGYGWGDTEADLVIHATAQQYNWFFTYEESEIKLIGSAQPLTLPVDTRIKFEIDSIDVIHSFWIPAFRMKIDAIPGRTTFVTVEPSEIGEYESNADYRVQCAELCGLDHSIMWFPVRVVSHEEFESWLAERQKEQGQ